MFQKKHKEQQSGNWRKRQTQEREKLEFCGFLLSSDTVCVYVCVEGEAWGLQRGSEKGSLQG